MDLNNIVNRHFQDTKGLFNQNSRFIDSGAHLHRNKVLILELYCNGYGGSDTNKTFEADNITFNVALHNALHIETISDVYLDNFITYNGKSSTGVAYASIVLNINEFDISTYSNASGFQDKVIIGNERDSGTTTQTHKSRKMNYISTLRPKTIHTLTGTLTTSDDIIFASINNTSHVRMEFIIVPRN